MNEKYLTQTDDGWWDSVLTDEGIQVPAPEPTVPEPIEPPEVVVWERAQKLYQQDEIVQLKVVGHNRGGVLVEGDELKGFVPYSHLVREDGVGGAEISKEDLSAYHGKTLKLKIIECVPEKERMVFSERAAQAGAGRRRELFNTLTRGKIVSGTVTNVTDFGAFVDLGGVEGLVHISELSWGRVNHPKDIVQVGEEIDVQVLDISPKQCRVALSLKRLLDNPWEKVSECYELGQTVPATITTLVSFGAFARLEEGVEGLIHRSEIPVIYSDLQKGDTVSVRILEIEAKKQRMGLSLKTND